MFFLSFLLAIDSNLADVYHPFDKSIQFQTRDFEVKQHNNDSSLYTMCVQKTESSQQCVLPYKEKPQALHYEKVLKRANPGIDGRRRVEKPSEWPHCVHGHLDMLFTTGLHAGSGTLVGPHHFLTCAHNVFHNKEWAKGLTVYLGLDNETAPYGAVSAAGVYVYQNWVENEDPDYDIALVVLKQSVGKKTGWAGMLCADTQTLAQKTVEITGYPADKSEGLKQMWTMSHRIEGVFEERLSYLIDTFYGQSGSGICHNELNSPFVVGVHTNGSTLIENNNSGVRLSQEKFARIAKWMRETGYIKQNFNGPNNRNTNIPKNPPSPVSQKSSLQLLREKADAGEAEALFELGLCHEEGRLGLKPNIGDAAKLYLKAANKEHPKAICKRGLFFLNGHIGDKSQGSLLEAFKLLKSAAEKNIKEAWVGMGLCIERGFQQKGFPSYTAGQCFQKAAELNDPEGLYRYGLYLEKAPAQFSYNGRDSSEVIKYFISAADQGHQMAQFKIADLCLNGTIKDQKIIEVYLQKAAEIGHKDAQFRVGEWYKTGTANIGKNPEKSFELYKKAADQGHMEAQEAVGICYYNAQGTVVVKNLAFDYWTKALQAGSLNADYYLGFYHKNSNPPDDKLAIQHFKVATGKGNVNAYYELGLYLEKENKDKEARDCFKKAAESLLNNKDVQFKYAYYCDQGKGGSVDERKAKECFFAAAKLGHSEAKCTYLLRCALERDWKKHFSTTETSGKEFEFFQNLAAAKRGNEEALFKLGVYCAEGKGVVQNLTHAIKWYREARNHGDALYALAVCYEKGEGVQINDSEMVSFLRKASEKKHKKALYDLAWYYSQGLGHFLKQDWAEAIKLYKQSAELGFLPAKEKIDILSKR